MNCFFFDQVGSSDGMKGLYSLLLFWSSACYVTISKLGPARPNLLPLLLQKVKKVIGIELCQEAVEDAKVNAQINGW